MKLRLRLFAVAMVAVSLAPAGASAQSPVSDTGWDEKALSERPKDLSVPMFKTPRCPQWWDEARAAGFSGRDLRILDYIMWRESRCEPKAIGWNYKEGMSHRDCRRSPAATYKKCAAISSYDSGLVQINSSWVTVTAQVCKSKRGDMTVLLEPDCNLSVAKHLMENTARPLGNWGF